jgi:hypothetical protein
MPSSFRSRSPVALSVWLAVVIAVAGALFAVTKISSGVPTNTVELAASQSRRVAKCPPPSTKKVTARSKVGTYVDSRGAIQHHGDGQEPLRRRNCPAAPATTAPATTAPAATDPAATDPAATDPAATDPAATDPAATDPAATTPAATTAPAEKPPLEILAKDCSQSKLAPHDGFQNGNRCVSTSFGEVAEAAQNPSLLIQNAPQQINAGQTFTIAVSTRNLVRDRFLAAGQGGYYVESSLLNNQGLVRGHFHTACRMLKGNEAQDPAPAPAFFVATEDGSGGATPDTVKITVAGLTTPGTAQCASWAGDGSHRIPMMQRANQMPAFDVVRIQVK